MAEHVLNTIIQLRYDNYSAWMNSDVILKSGEAAIATFPYQRTLHNSDDMPDHTPPAVGIKIGDGTHYFRELPWVQAVAADVYSWAKSSEKPVYHASEIQGLINYIEEYSSSGSGSGTIAPRIYQIVRGTNENSNKYYLQYKEDGSNQWITDTNHYIDVDTFVKVANWIGEDVDDFDDLGDRTEQHIQYDLNRLKFTDSQQSQYFVTAVSQTGGKINVTKKQLEYSDINGTLSVTRGGTGTTIFDEDSVLIGNGTGAILTRALDEEVNNNNHLVTNRAIKRYVDNSVAGLEGAMHYIGDATVAPTGNTNPQVDNYNFSQARAGDVVLWEQKEYVWTGGYWRLLGDEGSYAVKGSIKDADIDANANIAQSKIADLIDTFNTKVDKVEGKVLSSNDYTDEDKLKLQNIEEGAQVNIISGVTLNGTTIIPDSNKIINLLVNEFDTASREKLATIQEGAQVNDIVGITLNGTIQIPDNNKIVALTVKEFDDEARAKLATIQEGAQVNIIESIYLNNKQILPDNNKRIDLSIREYPKEDEDKLKTIAEGAQVNVIERIKFDNIEILPDQNKIISIISNPHTEHENIIEHITLNGIEQTPTNKIVALTIDQDFIKGAEIPTSNNTKEDITIIQKKLQFARIAVSGDISELKQINDTYVLIDCGNSTDVI